MVRNGYEVRVRVMVDDETMTNNEMDNILDEVAEEIETTLGTIGDYLIEKYPTFIDRIDIREA